eukprot:CAMPEP_0178422576 /NCGR_PEP_ID=MMETSP0689_2-20121128/27246_1 /TAXON_ID=160604 /ORGANISM="Amphidinium massartii, Strain CS-259" /LENGTH=358 /DNA_ID=CAMNT_0020044147 /DNA_START=24 /DNA_END=1100 /DNA_ORIENTATION=+
MVSSCTRSRSGSRLIVIAAGAVAALGLLSSPTKSSSFIQETAPRQQRQPRKQGKAGVSTRSQLQANLLLGSPSAPSALQEGLARELQQLEQAATTRVATATAEAALARAGLQFPPRAVLLEWIGCAHGWMTVVSLSLAVLWLLQASTPLGFILPSIAAARALDDALQARHWGSSHPALIKLAAVLHCLSPLLILVLDGARLQTGAPLTPFPEVSLDWLPSLVVCWSTFTALAHTLPLSLEEVEADMEAARKVAADAVVSLRQWRMPEISDRVKEYVSPCQVTMGLIMWEAASIYTTGEQMGLQCLVACGFCVAGMVLPLVVAAGADEDEIDDTVLVRVCHIVQNIGELFFLLGVSVCH